MKTINQICFVLIVVWMILTVHYVTSNREAIQSLQQQIHSITNQPLGFEQKIHSITVITNQP